MAVGPACRFGVNNFNLIPISVRLKQCFFGLQETEYLGYTVSDGEFSVSTMKVEAVAYWPVPTTQKEIRTFVQ
jgi:hypothetical protein